jgi:hypothetical protein
VTIFGWAQEATNVLRLWILIVFCLSSKFSGKIIGNRNDGVFVLVCQNMAKDAVDDATAETATALVDGGGGATAISHARIAKVIKPRPYGLFLAEKGASLILTNLWFINDFQRIIIVIIISRTTTTTQDKEGKYNSTRDGMGRGLLPQKHQYR